MADDKVMPSTHREMKIARWAWNEAVRRLEAGGDPEAERDLLYAKTTAYRVLRLDDGSEWIYAPGRSPIRPWWINGAGRVVPQRVRDEQPMTVEEYEKVADLMRHPLVDNYLAEKERKP